MKITFYRLVALVCVLSGAGVAQAQAWPQEPVRSQACRSRRAAKQLMDGSWRIATNVRKTVIVDTAPGERHHRNEGSNSTGTVHVRDGSAARSQSTGDLREQALRHAQDLRAARARDTKTIVGHTSRLPVRSIRRSLRSRAQRRHSMLAGAAKIHLRGAAVQRAASSCDVPKRGESPDARRAPERCRPCSVTVQMSSKVRAETPNPRHR